MERDKAMEKRIADKHASKKCPWAYSEGAPVWIGLTGEEMAYINKDREDRGLPLIEAFHYEYKGWS